MASDWQVGSYVIAFRSGGGGTALPAVEISSPDLASFATLKFTTQQPLPAPFKSANGLYNVYFPLEVFGPMLQVLRSEAPLFFSWSTTWAELRTGKETPGEDEGP